jgi:hypothetical protein
LLLLPLLLSLLSMSRQYVKRSLLYVSSWLSARRFGPLLLLLLLLLTVGRLALLLLLLLPNTCMSLLLGRTVTS